MPDQGFLCAPPKLLLWVVYDHPLDLPSWFVARRWILADGEARPDVTVMTSKSLPDLQRRLARMGLVAIDRAAEDDEKIVETWL